MLYHFSYRLSQRFRSLVCHLFFSRNPFPNKYLFCTVKQVAVDSLLKQIPLKNVNFVTRLCEKQTFLISNYKLLSGGTSGYWSTVPITKSGESLTKEKP